MYSYCTIGGWILGDRADGTRAEYVRIPYAHTSLYSIPTEVDEEALVMLCDILLAGFECSVLSGKGVDTAIEAVGVPATFVLCEDIVAPGGTISNVGVARRQGRPPPGAPVVAKHYDHRPSG